MATFRFVAIARLWRGADPKSIAALANDISLDPLAKLANKGEMQAQIEALALEIGISMSCVHGWRRVGRVAYRHRQALIDAGLAHRLVIQPADFDRFVKLRPGRPRLSKAAA